MLVTCNEIHLKEAEEQSADTLRRLDLTTQERYDECLVKLLRQPSQLGEATPGIAKHFYSNGAFNLIQLVVYLLSQTGPAHVFLSTYSISIESLTVLRRLREKNQIIDIKFLIDNRVKSISPIPFELLSVSFPGQFRSCALHAKVALIWNERWNISVVGSQNATHNPKLERGVIHTDPRIWEFDFTMLSDAFDKGAE